MKEFNPYSYVPVDHDPFAGPELERSAPTTEAQKEIWLSIQIDPDASCAYNESVNLDLKGKLDPDALKRSIQLLIDRHEGLRITFTKNGASMNILKSSEAVITEHDFTSLSSEEQRSKFDELVEKDQNTTFDIVHGPLFRCMIVKYSDERTVLVLNAHHLICDGWSMGVMMAEISIIYSALLKGEEPQLSEVYSLSEYAVDQIELMASEEYKEIETFWLEEFKGKVPEVDLPTDRPRPKMRTYAGARVDIELEQDIVKSLKKIGTSHASSFVTTLLSAFEVYISQLTGQRDLVLGLPAAGQSDSGHHYLIGHCVNLLALRSQVDPDTSFIDHIKKRKTGILDAFDHQKYTFGSLLQKLALPRVPGRIPLVQVVFNVDMNMDDEVAFDGLEHAWTSNPRSYENFELFLNATGSEDKLILEWTYKTDLFDEATIRSMMQGFRDLLVELIEQPENDLSDFVEVEAQASMAPAEKETAPYDPRWSGGSSEYPQVSAVELFRECAKEQNDKPALVLNDSTLSYAELDKYSNSLAADLAENGVAPGDLIGICMDRSFEMFIGMLGIWKAGAAYVPFDLSYPEQRLQFMASDTKVKFILCDELSAQEIPVAKEVIKILDRKDLKEAAAPDLEINREDAAYAIYTSGSTGTPKGVLVPHRSLVRLVRNQNYLDFSKDHVFVQTSNPSFDASMTEIWGALLNGGKLVLVEELKPTLSEILEAIEKNAVTHIRFPASLFNLMVDEHLPRLKALKKIIIGGDVLSVDHIRRALEELGAGVMINAYGPTENGNYTCCYPIDGLSDGQSAIPIGFPVSNTQVYILDENGQPVDAGVEGELHAAGDGLALRYLNQEELTAEKFVPDPFSKAADAKMYRTGDLARWTPNGTVEFIGRVDHQIKVRGFRVELGEIKTILLDHEAVRDGVVTARENANGEKQVVAYAVPNTEDKSEENKATIRASIEGYLKDSMPEYMLPSALVMLDEFPLNANGKVDLNALPAPSTRTHERTVRFEAPRDHLERSLTIIWQQLLKVEEIGVHDNFFELGGHSLLGISMFEQIKKQFDQDLSLGVLFQAPTVAELAKLIKEGGFEQQWDNLAAVQPAGDLPPFFCVHGDDANYFIPRYLGKDQPFYGFFHQGEDGYDLKYKTVEDLAAHLIREMLTVRPDGPYYLGGYSFGGILAFEMAQQLQAMGKEIGMLAVFDTAEPDEHARVLAEERTFYDPLKRAVMRPMAQRYLNSGKPLPPKLRHFNIIDTYDKAVEAYTAKPYNGDIVLLRAKGTEGERDMGWGKLVSGKVTVVEVPGDHYSIVKEPDVRLLAEKLGEQLDAIYKRNSVEMA